MTHENQHGGSPDQSAWVRLWSNHSPVGQLVLDRDGEILECNGTAAELLALERERLRGKRLHDLACEDSCKAFDIHFRRARESGAPQTCELHLNRGEGRPFDALVRSRFVRDDEPCCLVAFFDLRHWKGAEPGKLLVEEQLRQSQRLEVLGRLAAGVTHDFNNLLTLITGYSRLLTDQLREDSQLRRHAEKISKAGSQATELVSQLLAFSRKSELQSAVINVNEVIVDFDTMLRQIVGDDIELEAVLDPDLANIRVNPSQFDQVILNLATNARDAMPEGGTLTFETSDIYVSEPSTYGLSDKHEGRYVKLTVSDNGVGMSPEVQKKIFDPFYTTKDVGKGTGLGLATVFSVVSQYGGAIDVESEPGEGTTFELLFPPADASVDPSPAPIGLAEHSTGFESVLLVEHNEEVRHFAATVLEDYGYEVIEVATPASAVEIVSDRGDELSVIVTDVLEPASSNRKFLNSLQQLAPTVRIIQVCGYPPDDADDEAAAVLAKPYTPEQLAAKVRDVLDDSF